MLVTANCVSIRHYMQTCSIAPDAQCNYPGDQRASDHVMTSPSQSLQTSSSSSTISFLTDSLAAAPLRFRGVAFFFGEPSAAASSLPSAEPSATFLLRFLGVLGFSGVAVASPSAAATSGRLFLIFSMSFLCFSFRRMSSFLHEMRERP